MIDLTPTFDRALKRKSSYCGGIPLRVMNELASAIPGSTVDWDMENEDWGRILLNQKEIALICSLVPICFAEERLRLSISQELENNGVSVIYAHRLDDEIFKIDPSKLLEIYGFDVTDRADWQHISLHEIWFLTV
jgi:hypothetical protein